MTEKIKQYQYELSKFIRSTDFSKAIVLTVAIVLPIVIFSATARIEIGISLAMGCLLASPSDVPGSFKHKVLGILFAALLGSLSFLIAGYTGSSLLTAIPMLFLMMFSISYLSVYGFRASLVTFSGLLAVVLSFANLSTGIEVWEKSLLIAGGGLWYLLVSVSWYLIRPRRATEQLLAETMELTAEYLRLRSELLAGTSEEKELKKKIFIKQGEINEHHESLREILISSRRSSGHSGYSRKRLLIFIDLVDILELAMANPIDQDQMKATLKENSEELQRFVSLSRNMALHLDNIARALYQKTGLSKNVLPEQLVSVKEVLFKLWDNVDITQNRDVLLVLRNLYDYQAKQVQKLTNIDRILNDLEANSQFIYKSKDIRKFLTTQDYSARTLLTNFNFGSAIFRHSLRLSLVVLCGYLIGSYFSVQNSYWILLTIIVIMRPSYGLTKERTRKRIVGTLIGGALAVGIVYLTANTLVYTILGLISLTLAFSLIQRNYTTAAIFITLSIIFIYALLRPDVHDVIQYRILDTLVGAGLAAFGNLILWPKWEFKNIDKVISSSVLANLEYLSEIDWYYHKKDKLPVSYKLKRKKAFLEMGNLSGAFQRMTQEPKSRQKGLGLVYEVVELNQTFLSALASMGTYIRTHPTTRASLDFDIYTKAISLNLQNTVNILKGLNIRENQDTKISEASKSLRKKFDKLAQARDEEIESGKTKIDKETRHRLQEAHLITSQLEWLLDISEKLQLKVKKIKSENE
ncbi:FUSC family membrane protein [Gramella sp. KN1008]|uniref:FUSC family protein n=1 Tax=Gramella sp. KN1008 TaxID=2529298 RepID=UPI001F6100E4|nr:FUSC family membrane protein [Gramella sp. KN1008]